MIKTGLYYIISILCRLYCYHLQSDDVFFLGIDRMNKLHSIFICMGYILIPFEDGHETDAANSVIVDIAKTSTVVLVVVVLVVQLIF